MSSDQAPQIQTARGPNSELPEITDVKINYAPFKPRATRNFTNPMDAVKDAVEIVVSLQSPVPIRAMAPVLWVGGERLTESEAVDKEGKQMRFWGFSRAKLRSGAPLTMSWMNEDQPKTRKKAKFTYRPPESPLTSGASGTRR
jgi:hypothetical protein